jgi:molecular chaperone GrpE (heat shock protein)
VDPTAAGAPGAPADRPAPDELSDVDAARQLPEVLDGLRRAVEALGSLPSTVAALVGTAEKEHERAAFRESVIDQLHTENQRLRRGELESLLEPVRGGLFRLHDMARRAAEQCRTAGQGGAELLDAVADEAADVLLSVGVERYDAIPGEAYDAIRHRSVGAVTVDESARDRTVFEARSAGFTAPGGRVVRKANVVIALHPTPDPGRARSGEEEG